MYIPRPFEVSDLPEIKKFVAHVGSADLITVDSSGVPVATLMPCQWIEDETEFGRLIMHMSKGNAQWKEILPNQIGLAIVHGVQAYISPSNYVSKSETGKVVPTWNYTSAHITGTLTVSHDQEELLNIVSELTDFHEHDQSNPWKVTDAPSDYLVSQLNGIVGITMRISKVEAKAKLNQNRSSADRQGVIETLLASEKFEDNEVANLMTTDEKPINKLI